MNNGFNLNNNQTNQYNIDNETKATSHSADFYNQQNTSNTTNNLNNTELDKEETSDNNNFLGIITTILCLFGYVLFLLWNIYGLAIGVICLLVSLIFIRKNQQFIGVSFFLSAILCIIYVINIIVINNTNNDYLYRSKSVSFLNIARSYFDSAKKYANKNNSIECKEGSVSQVKIKLKLLDYKPDKVSFNKDIDTEKSYITIKATSKNKICEKKYYIYLTDGEYSIGKQNNPIPYEELDLSIIEKIK